MKYDVVYFVKNTSYNEELKYSLRSLEKNFPYNKVWFFGGCPKDLKPDIHIPITQAENSKYLNVRFMIQKAVRNKELTDDFYLFNDDFFIMSKVSYVIPTVNGSLDHLIQILENKYKNSSKIGYRTKLKETSKQLKLMNKDTLNYELHIPMLINKEKGMHILNTFNSNTAFRSSYGNYYNIAKNISPDVKVIDDYKMYDPDVHNLYLSTSDHTWDFGLIGEYIRSVFEEPSRFEIQ